MAMTPRSPELQELFCFDLYAASRAVTSVYRPLLAELGLTYPQYLVLVALWRAPTQRVKELTEALQLDYGTLTPLLRRLESNGLVTRTRRTDDERSVEVALTDAGKAMRKRAQHIPAVIQAAVGLDDDQIVGLQSTLRALTTSAAGYVPATQSRRKLRLGFSRAD